MVGLNYKSSSLAAILGTQCPTNLGVKLMNEPVTVTYSLEEVLKELKQEIKDVNAKLDKLNTIEVQIATLTEKVDGMDKQLEKVEGTQKNQVWALIVLLGGAIVTAGARLFFIANP